MEMKLDYNEVMAFMTDFGIDIINKHGELIIDEPTNTYVYIKDCKDIEEVKTRVVFALCRPIGKGLENKPANRLLKRLNDYFKVDLKKEDLLLMYGELCYMSKMDEFTEFIQRGFPMEELRKKE